MLAVRTSADVTCRVLAAITAQPACHGVYIYAIADEHALLTHGFTVRCVRRWTKRYGSEEKHSQNAGQMT